MNIAIQGYPGSFHHEAVHKYFGKDAEITPCASFRKLIETVANDEIVDVGLMAIENSIAGSILPNYNLLYNSDLYISGEVYLHIRQQLMAPKGLCLDEIREVHSHYMALLQCHNFLDRYAWKLVETEDTALSAANIKALNLKHTAAIASHIAAELYDLEIIAADIQDLQNNYTRFLVLNRGPLPDPASDADKASVSFYLEDKAGKLATILNIIASENINISKLQSFPIPGLEFQYYFLTDLEFDHIDQLYLVIEKIKKLTNTLTIKGIYKKSIWKSHKD